MVQFSKLAIFWLAFGCFVVPLFLIALICSIIKAFRDRHEIKQRMRERDAERANLSVKSSDPKDSEIVTTPSVRKKPNFMLIEDEDRRKQFRTTSGHLMLPDKPNIKKLKPRPKDTNVSNISGDLDYDTAIIHTKREKLQSRMAIGRNGHIKNKSRIEEDDDFDDATYFHDDDAEDEVIAEKDKMLNGKTNGRVASRYPTDTHIIHNNNGPAKVMKNGTRLMNGDHRNKDGIDNNMRNCKSLDEINKTSVGRDSHDTSVRPSMLEHNSLDLSENGRERKSNGSISNGHAMGMNNTISPMQSNGSATIGDGVTNAAMEMGSIADYGRSKSEDNLIEQRENTTDNHLSPENAMLGSENRAYAKSTETTAL